MPSKQSHSPMRTCLGCMRPDFKDRLVRLAARDDAIVADFGARHEGRGGYLHPRRECLERFVSSKVRVFRSLRRKIDLNQRREVVEAIRRRLDGEAAFK